MPHYLKMYNEKDFLFAFDLDGKEVTVTIERCTAGEITGEKGKKDKLPVLSFVGKKKRLGLNKTNGKTIASMYGVQTENWAGKSITLYPTTTQFGNETKECIRVRPTVPQQRAQKGKKDEPAPEPTESDEPAHDAETGEVAE